MAKQSGLHQIRGKVGEHSYYKQTGVSGGLIRSINQGMSARVKTDPAYANTRLNNQEFSAAANTAALLGQTVTPKFRPMILPFSQSKMSKEILKVARQHVANWGQRVVNSDDTAKLAAILSSVSKRDAAEFIQMEYGRGTVDNLNVMARYTAEQAALMTSLGISGIAVVTTQFDIATGQWISQAGEMSTGYLVRNESYQLLDGSDPINPAGAFGDEDFTIPIFVPESGHAAQRIVVTVIMPCRTLNNTTHILQEYCSFVAIALPEYEG